MPDSYADSIIKDIKKLVDKGFSFDTLYIGGGNPALLSDKKIIEIIERASQNKRPMEISIEMNPEELSKERLYHLMPYIDRISIGIQSLNEKALKVLGRNSSRKSNINALSLLAESGINYNADLITSILYMKVEDTLSDIRELSNYMPSHISFYSLSYEEGTPLYKLSHLRDEEYEYQCLKEGWKTLNDLGYEHYEISNFAKDGRYSRHNLNYWKLNQYIGLGSGAESSVGWKRIYSCHNDESIEKYIDNYEMQFEELSREEALLEYIMVSLRTKWGIDKAMMKERFDIPFDDIFTPALKKLDNSLYINKPSSFSLTEDGFMILDSIILELSMLL